MTDLEEKQDSRAEMKFEKTFSSTSLSAGVCKKYAASISSTVRLGCYGWELI